MERVSLKGWSEEDIKARKLQQRREAQKRYYQKNKDYYKQKGGSWYKKKCEKLEAQISEAIKLIEETMDLTKECPQELLEILKK